jgi:hypothetical protein
MLLPTSANQRAGFNMSDDILGLIIGFIGGGVLIAIYMTWQARKSLHEGFDPR